LIFCFCAIEHHIKAEEWPVRENFLLGNVVALRLEAILVGDVVQRDDLTVGSGPADRSLDGELLVFGSQVVHHS
jgi:hypothetical protein